jgi:microcystin-dependent protein
MSDQFIAEIRIFPFNFAPQGWAQCNGQVLAISQNTALFSLLGTSYGGNGTSNFVLPNFQNLGVLCGGQGVGLSDRLIGETGGEQTVTLNISQMPAHTHIPAATNAGILADPGSPSGATWGEPANARPAPNFYASTQGTAPAMNVNAISVVGGSQPHDNMMPYLVLNYCIALSGIYPQRN